MSLKVNTDHSDVYQVLIYVDIYVLQQFDIKESKRR